VAALLATAHPGEAAAARAALPLEPLSAGLWTVTVDATPVVPGITARWRFLVDTGSTHTVIAEAAAARAGLTVAPGRWLLTPAGRIEVGEARLPELRLGDRVRAGLPVLVTDLAALGRDPRIDGILGMDVLDADRLVLDLVAGTLLLTDADDTRVARRGSRLPARTVNGRLVVDARVDGRVRALVLDSGAAITVLYDDPRAGAEVRLGTAGGARLGRATRAELSAGALHLGAVPAVRVQPPATRAAGEGLLPAAVFARIDIDRVTGRVHAVPRR